MIQTIKYKCCGKVFAACTEPECYIDEDWLNELKEYVKQGNKVEMVDNKAGFKLEKCTCKVTSKLFIQGEFEF